MTVRELLQKVQAGEIRIPRFQRPLRWQQRDVVELMDSIWRGYPIGSLLLWKRRADAGQVQIGGAVLSAPAVADAWWVVDGQQRTTALAASLLELDHAGDSRWIVRFDAQEEVFRPGPVPPDRISREVPLSALGDLRRLGRWIRESDLSDDDTTRIENAQQRLLDYAIPAYVVETEDEQALRGVFARANSTGARMRVDEVFQALLGAPASAEHSSLDLDDLQRRCEVDGFGSPPRADILKAVFAISGLDPTRRLDDLPTLAQLNNVSREDVAQALSRTIEFLRQDCQIPHFALIPYPVVFFILARWFHIHQRSEAPVRVLLARWVWRGAVTGAHQRAEVSRMRAQVRDIQKDDEQGSLDRLLAQVGAHPTRVWDLGKFDHRNARSRIEMLALLAQRPRDRFGFVGVAELMSDGCGRIAREVFRSADSKSASDEVGSLAKTAANRALLGGVHTGLSGDLRTWSWEAHGDALRSHLIDERSFILLVAHDVEAFLRRRSGHVLAAVNTFLAERAAWDEPELRPLRLYLDGGNGDASREE